ncbi:HalOD1 output domain-containing protein [Salinarchaeum laminariae]|uniref:HalOD1 output domain-containing protein n=1 Tax=Salinarchaeum laminariae TaxID=869888 RepID=UPI0020BF95D6|nr:HalOD1 output domain-containing protein [Salinarchaeum laminariae]
MGIAPNDDLELQASPADGAQTAVPVSSQEPPSLTIVTAIANAIGDDPTAMNPLYETVDTDALDRLLESDATLEIVFEYEGHAVEVGSDGVVTVDGEQHSPGDRV